MLAVQHASRSNNEQGWAPRSYEAPDSLVRCLVSCRHERLPVQLLSDAAKSHNTRDLLDLLQQLLDFLNLPGPVSRYLPRKDNIPLQHLGVLDMHVEAAALHAVNLMLGSSVFSSSASTGSNGAAFFCVRLKEEVSTHYEVLVYAMSGGDLHKWPKGDNDFAAGTQVIAVPLPAAPSGTEASSSSSSSGGSIKATEMVGSPYVYGVDVSGKVHRLLSERISTVLRGALAQVPFRGSTGAGLQQMAFTAYWSKEIVYHKASCVRAVWW